MQHNSRKLIDITNAVHGRCTVMFARALVKDERACNQNQYCSSNTNTLPQNNKDENIVNREEEENESKEFNCTNYETCSNRNGNNNDNNNNTHKVNVYADSRDVMKSVQEISMSPIISCENDTQFVIDKDNIDVDNVDCIEIVSVAFKQNKLKRFRCIGKHNEHSCHVGQFAIVPGDRGEDCGEVVAVHICPHHAHLQSTNTQSSHTNFDANVPRPITDTMYEHTYLQNDAEQQQHYECQCHQQDNVKTRCCQQKQQRELQQEHLQKLEETESELSLSKLDDTEFNNYEEIIRIASYKDVQRLLNDIPRQERVALHVCRHLVARFALTMTIIDCEYQFDLRKITFFFVANKKVVFNCLSKELYRIFHARIWFENLWQPSSTSSSLSSTTLLPSFANYVQRQQY